jgi:hypothetical protein
LQVFVDNVAANAQHSAKERREQLRAALTKLERHRLYERNECSHQNVHAIVNYFLPHGSESFPIELLKTG